MPIRKISFLLAVFVLTVLVIPKGFSQDTKLDSLYAALSKDFSPAQDSLLYQKLILDIDALTSDTIAGRYFQKFAHLRDGNGLWDTITKTMLLKAYERYDAFGDPCKTVIAQFSLTRVTLFQGPLEETLSRAKKGLELAKTCGELKHIAHAQSYLGAAYINLGRYKTALEYLITSEKNYEQLQDESGIAMVNLDKAIVYDELNDDVKAGECTKKAAMIYKAQPDKQLNYGIALIDLTTTYLKLKQYDSIKKYLPIAHKIVEGKHQMAMSYVYQNYGTLYFDLGNYDTAIDYYNKAIALNKSIDNTSLNVTLYGFLSEIYIKKQQPDTAYEYALKADSIAQAMDNTSLKLANLPNLAEASYAKKLYTESHEALKTYIHLYDSIKGVERVKEISALEEAYEAEKRENVIQLQQQENALLQEKNRASNNRNWAFGILALLIALVAYLLIHRFRLKNQQQRIQMKIRELENANLNKEINYKNRELTSKVLQIAQKNELLEELKSNLDTLKRTTGHSREVNQLYNKLQIEKQIDENWDSFLKQFTEINPKFYEELDQRHEGLTKNDFRLAALVKMNVNSKDIASILNISPEGVKKARYRLRKKLHLNSDDNLEQYLMML